MEAVDKHQCLMKVTCYCGRAFEVIRTGQTWFSKLSVVYTSIAKIPIRQLFTLLFIFPQCLGVWNSSAGILKTG